MYKVLEQEGIEIWIYILDPAKQVRCIAGENELIIDIETLQIHGYFADQPSGKFLNEALRIVTRNQKFLLQKWEECNQ